MVHRSRRAIHTWNERTTENECEIKCVLYRSIQRPIIYKKSNWFLLGKKKWKMISSDKWSVIYLHFLKTLLIKHYIKNLPGRLIHTASRIRSLGMITVAWLGVRKWLSQQMTDLANATRQKAVGLFAWKIKVLKKKGEEVMTFLI